MDGDVVKNVVLFGVASKFAGVTFFGRPGWCVTILGHFASRRGSEHGDPFDLVFGLLWIDEACVLLIPGGMIDPKLRIMSCVLQLILEHRDA